MLGIYSPITICYQSSAFYVYHGNTVIPPLNITYINTITCRWTVSRWQCKNGCVYSVVGHPAKVSNTLLCLDGIILLCIPWQGIIWQCMTWQGITRPGITGQSTMSQGMTWQCRQLQGMTWQGITGQGMLWQVFTWQVGYDKLLIEIPTYLSLINSVFAE